MICNIWNSYGNRNQHNKITTIDILLLGHKSQDGVLLVI